MRFFTNPLKTGDIYARMRKQCVRGLSSGGGAWGRGYKTKTNKPKQHHIQKNVEIHVHAYNTHSYPDIV